MIEVRCGMGLGNRVAAMANGLSRADMIRFVWRINEHCPAAHDEVFPAGIPGVVFETQAPPAMATAWSGVWCYDWHAAADRRKANAAYGRIMAAMVGSQAWNATKVAVFGRFHRAPFGDPMALAEAAADACGILGTDRAFILSDMHRREITRALESFAIRVNLPSCGPLVADLARTKSDLLDYASDWATLLAARSIVALDGPSSALHPARAAGTQIRYV